MRELGALGEFRAPGRGGISPLRRRVPLPAAAKEPKRRLNLRFKTPFYIAVGLVWIVPIYGYFYMRIGGLGIQVAVSFYPCTAVYPSAVDTPMLGHMSAVALGYKSATLFLLESYCVASLAAVSWQRMRKQLWHPKERQRPCNIGVS